MSILLTGMPKGEVEHLTWEDISFELAVIFIQEKPDMQWKPKTDERMFPFPHPQRRVGCSIRPSHVRPAGLWQ